MRENKIYDNDGYRPIKYFRTTTLIHTYDIKFVIPSTRENVDDVELDWTEQTRERAAQILRTGRKHGANQITVKHHTEFRIVWTTLCKGCYARESEWDWDCDGQHDTINCGVCDWHAAFNSRRTRNVYCHNDADGDTPSFWDVWTIPNYAYREGMTGSECDEIAPETYRTVPCKPDCKGC